MVKLFVEYESMETALINKIVVEGENLKDALLNLSDRMHLYIFREDVEADEEEGVVVTEKDLLGNLYNTNGDGCDYIIFMKDNEGHIYMNNFDEEEW